MDIKIQKIHLHPHLRFSVFLLMTRFFAKTSCWMLALKYFKPRNTVSGRGFCALRVFGQGSFLPRAFFHWHLSCRIGDCWKCHHGVIREGEFAKGASSPGSVMLEALDLGTFGRGCKVPCNLSKRSKYVETKTEF